MNPLDEEVLGLQSLQHHQSLDEEGVQNLEEQGEMDHERLRLIMESRQNQSKCIKDQALQKSLLEIQKRGRKMQNFSQQSDDDEVRMYASEDEGNRDVSPHIPGGKERGVSKSNERDRPRRESGPSQREIGHEGNSERLESAKSSSKQYQLFEVKCNPALSFMYKINDKN